MNIGLCLRQILNQKENWKSAPNGSIPLETRLAVTLRFFAGGDPYDLMEMFGISHSSVFTSIDLTMLAIVRCEKLQVKYPESHEEQMRIHCCRY